VIKQLFNNIKGDKYIWIIVMFLAMISFAAVYSSSGILAIRNGNDASSYIIKHTLYIFLGIACIYLTQRINYKHYATVARIGFWLGIPLLLYTLFFGATVNDASRWIKIPIIGIQFQTSDVAKLILIMYLARILSLMQEKISSFKEAFIPACIPILIYCGLILPENFSTAALIGLVCVILLFMGGIDWKQLVLVGLVALTIISGGFLLCVKLDVKAGRLVTWKNRIEAFSGTDLDKLVGNYNPNATEAIPEKSIYNIEQSDYAKIAIATAGISGKGPGNSVQRNFLPHPYSDFIFAIIIEEYGWMGALLVMFLYLALLYRGIKIVLTTKGKFGALLAGGLTIMLVLQAFVHMAVNVSLFPTTGQTLPLISMGGTSILFTAASVGIILSVSRYNEQNLTNKKPIVANSGI
jgi:cell division protein FtsW